MTKTKNLPALVLIYAAILCCLPVTARASTITLSSTTISSCNYGGSTATLRVYASETFVASEGAPVMGSAVGSTGLFKLISSTIASTRLSIPSFTLPSTTDSSRPNAKYTAVTYDSKNVRRDILFSDRAWPVSLGTPITYQALERYNSAVPRPNNPVYLNRDDVGAMIKSAVTGSNAAAMSDVVREAAKSRTAPENSANPIVIERSDPLANAEYHASLYSDDLPTAVAAIAAIVGATDAATVTVSKSNATATASYTMPANITLKFVGAGKVTISSGQTLTVGNFEAQGTRQRFAGSGVVRFSGPGIPPFVHAGWWGLKADGITDDTLALQAAIDAVPTSQGAVSLPPGNIRITDTIVLDAKLGLKLISGLGLRHEAYGGTRTTIYWDGSAGKIMLRMVNTHSTTIQGIGFNFYLNAAANGAGYGIFATSEANLALTGVSVNASSTSVTATSGTLYDSIPNGDAIHRGRTIRIPGAGPAGATLVTTIASVIDHTHFTITATASTKVAAGTATVTSPYASSPGNNATSHLFEGLSFNWSGVTNNLAYRTGIAIDPYRGTNAERIQLRNSLFTGNGGAGSTTSNVAGIGVSSGGFYDSGTAASVSPLKCGGSNNCGGGSNILQSHAQNVSFQQMSYAFHGWSGIIDNAQGSYLNVPFFGGFNGIVNNARFETTRQFFHGAGTVTFNHSEITNNSIAGASVFEAYGGSTRLVINGAGSPLAFSYRGTGTKMASATSPTNATGIFTDVDAMDSDLSARAGTDFTGFNQFWFTNSGQTVVKAGQTTFTGGYASVIPASMPDGTIAYCTTCVPGSNPAAASGGTGAFIIRQNSTWIALGTLRGTASWDPPNIANGATGSTTITLTGLAAGDPCIASFSGITTTTWGVQCVASSANTATMLITNNTGGAVNLAPGTAKASAIQ